MKKKVLSLVLALAMASSAVSGISMTATAEESGEPVYGGVLKYASHCTTSTPGWTPENTNNASLIFLTAAYESLTYYDESGAIVPKLAAEWTTDPDEPSITWTLREGVQFADGTDFNAEAVKVNIEAYQEAARNETANIASCEVIDDYTIKMILNEWNSSTLEGVGFFVYYMSPAAMEDPDTLRNSSCGTGAFQVTEFNPGVSVKYAKNENYWQEGKPYLDGVEIYTVDEPTTRASAFEAGEYDVILMNNLTVSNDLVSKDLYKVESNSSGQGLVMTGLIPNSALEGPFQDPLVRRAMAHALDTEALSNAFGYGMLTTTNQWAAPGAPTYNDTMNGATYDPDKARELLAQAGYPDGFETTMTVNPGDNDYFTAAANMLSEVGIRCNINLVDESAQSNLYMTGTWEGIMGHYATVSPDLGLYMGRHLDVDGAFYANGIQHPDDHMELLQAIRVAPTEEEKIELEHQMQELIYGSDNGSFLFGLPLFMQNETILEQQYVEDLHRSIEHVWTWNLENCWFNK